LDTLFLVYSVHIIWRNACVYIFKQIGGFLMQELKIKIDKTKTGPGIFGITDERAKEMQGAATYALNLGIQDETNKVILIAKAIEATAPTSIEEIVYITYIVSHKIGQMAALQDGLVSLAVVQKKEI
jgi:hypothetical protein